MAVQFYTDQSTMAPQSGLAGEEVYAGEIVVSQDGAVSAADAQTADPDGLALFSEEFMVGEDEDDVVEEKYESGERARFAPFHGALIGFGRTLPDEGGAAPQIGHDAVVGLVDTSVGDAPAGAAGRLVEEGYTNGATTFERGNGNFVALGKAYRPAPRGGDVTEFDRVVRVDFYGTAQE